MSISKVPKSTALRKTDDTPKMTDIRRYLMKEYPVFTIKERVEIEERDLGILIYLAILNDDKALLDAYKDSIEDWFQARLHNKKLPKDFIKIRCLLQQSKDKKDPWEKSILTMCDAIYLDFFEALLFSLAAIKRLYNFISNHLSYLTLLEIDLEYLLSLSSYILSLSKDDRFELARWKLDLYRNPRKLKTITRPVFYRPDIFGVGEVSFWINSLATHGELTVDRYSRLALPKVTDSMFDDPEETEQYEKAVISYLSESLTIENLIESNIALSFISFNELIPRAIHTIQAGSSLSVVNRIVILIDTLCRLDEFIDCVNIWLTDRCSQDEFNYYYPILAEIFKPYLNRFPREFFALKVLLSDDMAAKLILHNHPLIVKFTR